MIPMMVSKHWRGPFMALLLLAAITQLGTAAMIMAKAEIAQMLIAKSWERSVSAGGSIERPWPWADTWPVARLEVPRMGVDLFVLWGAQGNSLAFGPGYETASAAPGHQGTTVIGGHRDTHFKFLQRMELGTLISVQLRSGKTASYRVSDLKIVDTSQAPYMALSQRGSKLVLVTCYPFDTLQVGGPLRYVVMARRILNPQQPS